MKEQRMIKLELLKNMMFNLILFTIIFSTFGTLILTLVNSYLYRSVDNELSQVKEQVKNMPQITVISDKTQNSAEKLFIEEVQNYIDKISNLRVITILRNDDGEVLATSLSGKVFSKSLEKIDFNKNHVNGIYEMCINYKYYYRGTSCKVATADDEYYIELLINTNSEKEMMERFTRILTISTSLLILLSIFISFYFAKKTLDPIVRAYKKQAEFVQNASHELRTPLTIIQAKQEMLLQSPESKIIDKSEDIALTLSETRRLSKMVKELMDLARSDINKDIINKTKIDLNELVKNVVIPYEEMAKMQNKVMTVNTNCKDLVNIDPNKIKQLLIILLDNALKYTEENDSIYIDVKNIDEKIFINVKDTGIGISDEALKHVFERFYREDKARCREKGGTGLGLSIAHTIVKNHGGTIKIVHNKPKGIIVIVKL